MFHADFLGLGGSAGYKLAGFRLATTRQVDKGMVDTKGTSCQERTSKHTRGPWDAEEEDRTCWKITSVDYGGIALLHDPCAEEMLRDDELEANARLIAAAPELLGALKAVLYGPGASLSTAVRQVVSEAIAKAEGGAK